MVASAARGGRVEARGAGDGLAVGWAEVGMAQVGSATAAR